MTRAGNSVGMSEANALNPFAKLLFVAAASGLNKRASAKFALRQFQSRWVWRAALAGRNEP